MCCPVYHTHSQTAPWHSCPEARERRPLTDPGGQDGQTERERETHIKTVFTPNFMTAEDLPPFLPQKVEISQRNFLSLEGQSTRFILIEVQTPQSVRVSQMYRGRGLILSGRQHATITATHFIIGHSRAHVKEQPDTPLSGDAMLLSPLSL